MAEAFKEFGVFQLLPDSRHGKAANTVCVALDCGGLPLVPATQGYGHIA
jgi:hypothetical protein